MKTEDEMQQMESMLMNFFIFLIKTFKVKIFQITFTKIVFFCFLSSLFCFTNFYSLDSLAAEGDPTIYIKIGEAKTKKSLMAFPTLQYLTGTPNAKQVVIGTDLYKVINNDLMVSTYFQMISPNAYLEDPSKTSLLPAPGDPKGFKFDAWKQIGTEFLLRMAYSISGTELTLETYTYHVDKANLIFAKRYKGPVTALRKMAHTFSNDLMLNLTGKEGMYLSKFVVASDRAGSKFKEIYTMDWDGYDPQKITNHKSISLSPTWSPDATKIAYTAFVQNTETKSRNADLFIYEFKTEKRWLVSYRQGINSGSFFTPDSNNIVLTLSQGETPDIYRMTLKGDVVSKLTNGPRGAMNVEPAISPDGSKIAFSSDRSGQPMVYVMDMDGSNPKRITFAGKYNSTPAWSPDGKRMAFAGWSDDHFDIFTMSADGTDMLRITSARKKNGKWAQNEDPSYSPDGRYLVYTSNRTGTNQIYISNLDGSEERRITSDKFNYYRPKWSKNIE